MNSLIDFFPALIGILSGILLGMVLADCVGIYKEKDANEVLNDSTYKIDTITTIANNDTTYTYKFIKK